MAHIVMKEIAKEYGSNQAKIMALHNVNLEIFDKELVVILGPSGAGKSTLLNILGGMDTPTKGSYKIDDEEIVGLDDKKLGLFRRLEIGFVFQFYNLIQNMTAYENVAMSANVSKNPLDPEEVLTLVGLDKRLNNFPQALSGGEQQRVSIARAIVKRPKLLLCDEPTGALDSKTGKSIISLLKEISHEGNQTVIIVTHNSNLAAIADRVIRISDGSIISNTVNENPKEVDEIEW